MKKFTFCFLSVLFFSGLVAQDQICFNSSTPLDPKSGENGFVNQFGVGCEGNDVSTLQFNGLGMNNFGFLSRYSKGATIADDFTLTKTESLDDVYLYAFKDESVIDISIEKVFIRIWDGEPGVEGSNIIFGDLETNRLVNSEFSGIYRTNDNLIDVCLRPIMQIQADLDVELDAGTYWIEWQFVVPLNVPRFRSVPLTTIGESTTGNGVQSFDNGESYELANDAGTNTTQGFPFLISCRADEAIAVPTLQTWGLVNLMLILISLGLVFIFSASFKESYKIS